MQPYYDQDGITIYHADCREVLPTLRATVAVTDPPYGVGLIKKHRDSRLNAATAPPPVSTVYQDDAEYVHSLISQVIPILLNSVQRAVVFCGTRMMWAYPTPTALGCVFLPSARGLSSWGFQCMQPILFYGKDPYLATGKGARRNSFSTVDGGLNGYDHPCPKPLAWMRWAITRASIDASDVVIDPFMGSGTTLRAAKDMGLRAIGIEIEEKYCEIAAERLRQRSLFEVEAVG